MKMMKRLLLIHWHYFNHQMIEFDKINFLTGQNSTGKSTIIDAMQLLLLCDTSGSFFNKAANARGNRTLTGYLRGELGDDEDAGFRYLRSGRFTSYIVLEFLDDVRHNWFTVGCCFDTFGENDTQKLFFRIDGKIPDHEFTGKNEKGNRVPFSIDDLRSFIRVEYPSGNYTTGVNRDFREDLCGKLGGIQPQRFSELLKKAVSFDPSIKIRDFITDFICSDEEKVNISDLLDNIRSYDVLKREADNLKERIALLADINDSYSEYLKNKDNEVLYSFLIDCADLDIKTEIIDMNKDTAEQFSLKFAQLEAQLGNAEKDRNQLQSERDSLKLQLDGNEDARHYDELMRMIEVKKTQCFTLQNNFVQVSALLQRAFTSWEKSIQNTKQKTADIDLSIIDPMLSQRLSGICNEGAKILGAIQEIDFCNAQTMAEYDLQQMTSLFMSADNYRGRSAGLMERFQEAQTTDATKISELNKEKELLEKGKFQFPNDAVDLKEAIESRLRVKYGEDAKAVIVAEAAEIISDRWRNVIEGYLGNQKYYVIVAPEHFEAAFKLYDSVKRQKSVYNTGLVDTEKLQSLSPKSDVGSLAEEMTTENPSVRLYLDFILGRVQKCDNINMLRRHRTSITDDGMLYQNFVVRAMDPKRWDAPAIGRAGARLRLEAIIKELADLTQRILVYASLSNTLHDAEHMQLLSDSDAEQSIAASNALLEIPSIKETIVRLEADADMIDRSEVEALQKRLEQREKELEELYLEIRGLERQRGESESRINEIVNVAIPALEAELELLQRAFSTVYSTDYIAEIGKPRYERELLSRGHAGDIRQAFPREQTRSKNAKDDMWTLTRDLRSKYNETYKIGYDISADQNDIYMRAFTEFSDNKLPEYEAKIEDTRNKAFLQFKEDFLSRLQRNIFSAMGQIEELNAAMKGSHFGEDTYSFRVSANPEYKRYYDMIVDKMTLEGGYNLFTDQYESKYAEEMSELFSLITNDNNAGGAAVSEDYEKRVATFTDYKTYLSFDLEVVKPNGETERLSKTQGKKSGGETQTPFYIAVLASFVQLYRVGRDKRPNTVRLILFDEAFSKMDDERILQSIALLKRYNFQTVLAAPPGKAHEIATLVDRNLCVVREGRKTFVLPFDINQIEELTAEYGQ